MYRFDIDRSMASIRGKLQTTRDSATALRNMTSLRHDTVSLLVLGHAVDRFPFRRLLVFPCPGILGTWFSRVSRYKMMPEFNEESPVKLEG